MDLTPYISNLREDLAATASAGDDQTRRAAALLSGALEPAVRLAIMNALADFAAETTASLPDYVVEVRLDGRDVRVVVTGNGSNSSEPAPRAARNDSPPVSSPPMDGGDISRMTLRLVEQIKGRAEQAASAQGVSLNTFISRAVQGALGQGSFKGGHSGWGDKTEHGKQSDTRLHGWVRG